jgi:hypothetical protein
MNILLLRGKYTIFGAIISTLVLTALWKLSNPIWSTSFFISYLFFFGHHLGIFILPKEKRIWQIFWGVLGILSLFIILLSGIYWFFEINKSITSLTLVIIPILIGLQNFKKDEETEIDTSIDLESYAHIKSYLSTKFWIVIVLIGQIAMFSKLFERTYDDTLISPWTLFGQNFFIIFFVISLILLWVLQKSKHIPSNLLLITTHTGLILSVVLIIFKYGFGFDPHIHQATENWIAQYGSILPKQPYYIGQYVIVIISHFITKLDIFTLDKILVPLGATLTIPLSSYFALSRADFKYKIFPALALIPLIPLTFFTVTTPNNLALLLAFLVGTWIWYEHKNGNTKTNLLGLFLSFTACAIHPMIGLPTLIVYLGSLIFTKIKIKSVFYPIYTIILAATVPLALFANSIFNKGSLSLQNTFANINDFLVIFKRPHYIFIERGSDILRTLYYYRDVLKPLMILILIIGIFVVVKKHKNKLVYFFLSTSIGLILSSFFITTSIHFKDVISYDQRLYGARLLDLALILMIPFFILALRELFAKIRKQSGKQFFAAIFFSALLLASWFFTYPTRDNISLYTGQNVRKADIGVVHAIDAKNNNKQDYIVLTNQTIGVTALREFGFDNYLDTPAGQQYFYSIPTGGPLYQYFRKMVYQEPKKQWMEEAMRFAGVKKAYFVHTNYWAPAAEIRDAAKLEADNWWELYGGRVWVYEYLLK